MKITIINERHAPLNDDAALVFPDIYNMYPNVDTEEAIEIVGEKYEDKPSEYGLPKDCVIEALKMCQECNCVQFNNRFYLPCRGCAMGPAHGCDLTDIFIGPIAEKHVTTCLVETCDFSTLIILSTIEKFQMILLKNIKQRLIIGQTKISMKEI